MSEQSPAAEPRYMDRRNRRLSDRLLRGVASVASVGYGAASACRDAGYRGGWLQTHRAGCPVVSIGNITTGGTGKTPMVIWSVEQLRQAGRSPAVLLRGYRSDAQGRSDEATLLSGRLPGAPIIVNPDRVAAAGSVHREHPTVDALVLDDGFQHRRLGRDVDLVLIDATNPFGYGHLLPRGLLREPLGALGRADAVVVTRSDRVDAAARQTLSDRVTQAHGRPPIAWAEHIWSSVVDERDRPVEPRGQAVVAVCGIGNPRSFLDHAASVFDLRDRIVLGDHHHYQPADMQAIAKRVAECEAAAAVTTEKDWVKMKRLVEDADQPAVWRPRLDIAFSSGEAELVELLTRPWAGATA